MTIRNTQIQTKHNSRQELSATEKEAIAFIKRIFAEEKVKVEVRPFQGDLIVQVIVPDNCPEIDIVVKLSGDRVIVMPDVGISLSNLASDLITDDELTLTGDKSEDYANIQEYLLSVTAVANVFGALKEFLPRFRKAYTNFLKQIKAQS